MEYRKISWVLLGFFAVLPVYLWGCQALEGFNYPTKTDVNDMRSSDIRQRTEIADSLAKLMTDQHGEMTPGVAEALKLMNDQFVIVSAELDRVTALVQAQGVDGTELAALAAVAFPGIGGLWMGIREKTKPSRSAGEVEKLKSEAVDAKEKMHAIELALAKAAGAGDAVPTLASNS